jgi:CPA1 family monovalent cation:H+ antiporter
MAEEIIAVILLASSFLVAIAAVHHYVKSFIIPAVAVMMALGAISVFLPTPEGFEFEDLYHFVETDMSEVILLVIIPILIFESGRKVKMGDIKHEATHIGFFAIIGVIVTIFLIGFLIGAAFEIPLIHALLFGAILAATDPVAVGAIFSKFPIPHRLNTLI